MSGELNRPALQEAARDLRYLLNRGYPRAAALTLVGNRHALTAAQRHLLHRGVFATAAAVARRAKLLILRHFAPQFLALDGHNVLITLECALRGLPLILADDGFLRDIGAVSHHYRPSAFTAAALDRLAQYLAPCRPAAVRVFYDAPLSRSGDLAARTQEVLQASGLTATARAVPVPETELRAFPGLVCTSDTDLIDRLPRVADLAGEIIRAGNLPGVISLD